MAGIIELKVEGMTCNNCAASVRKLLERKGLKGAQVNFATKEVRFQSGSIDLEEVKKGIEKLGFTVVDDNTKPPFWTLKRMLIFCAIFTIPLFSHMFVQWAPLHNPYVQLALSIPVFIIGCFHFGKSAVNSLLSGVPNMDVLIFIGSTSAFIYSVTGTFLMDNPHQYLFYETSAMIVTLVLLGNYLEHQSVEKTTSAIEDLSSLQAQTAKRLKIVDGNEVVKDIPLSELMIGDVVQVNEGDAIPADGTLLTGSALINESMLSGESLPLNKEVGDALVGASIVEDGNLTMRVEAIGNDTVLSKIIDLVKSAQEEKPDIQRLADRISAIFVPVVLLISIATFLLAFYVFNISFQQALMNAIAVLVISCPCAMGLATPTAVMVGVGRVAKNGILIRGGKTLEEFAKIKNIVFDKTGTLTTGKFEVSDVQYLSGDHREISNVIHQLESHSSHPIAKALSLYFKADKVVDFTSISEEKGKGLFAKTADGVTFKLGSSRLLKNSLAFPNHSVFLLKDDELLVAIAVKDQLRKGVRKMMKYLQSQDIRPIILSGDQNNKVAEAAEQLAVKEFYGEQLPEDKLKHIDILKQKGATAMVGDGINDAPALAKANIGISLSNASQVAVQSSQIVLLNERISAIEQVVAISKGTLQTIKENLFWAFAYNVVAIPIAALGFLNPMWGALFMAFSDVIVIGNSIRLKTRKLK